MESTLRPAGEPVPKVSVLMPTYNHAPYIGQAIESFLAQQCTFPIELLIGEDCSTDATRSIARKYADQAPDKIRLFEHSSNQGLLLNYKFLLQKVTSTYIAILESDDYWTDILKLQKQVDFLESHPDYGLVFTGVRVIDQDDHLIQEQNYAKHSDQPNTDIYRQELIGNVIPALTACFRTELYRKHCNIDDYIARDFKTIDYPIWLALSANSRVYCLEDQTAVYRCLHTSISNTSNWESILKFNQSMDEIVAYSIALFGSGGMSNSQIHNIQIYRSMLCGLKYNQISYVKAQARKLRPIDLKSFIIKYCPTLWIKKNTHYRINNA